MKTIMYPIAPDDDFPEMFCVIRLYDGEHQFYTPKGERTNALLSRMHKEAMEMEEAIDTLTDGNQRLRVDNAMLRELCDDLYAIRDRSGTYHVTGLQVRLDELGVEVD